MCGVLGVLGGFGKWHDFGTFEEWAWESRPRALVFSAYDLIPIYLPCRCSSWPGICSQRTFSTLFSAKWNGDGLFERRGGEGAEVVALRRPPSAESAALNYRATAEAPYHDSAGLQLPCIQDCGVPCEVRYENRTLVRVRRSPAQDPSSSVE